MKELIKVTNTEGREVNVMDSREVAEMMEKTHAEIIQYLEGLNYKDGRVKITGIIPTLEQSGIDVSNYFIESTYNDRGRIKKCYLITKQGAEILGSKMQGAKGVLFNMLFNDRFKTMECDDIKNDVRLVCETLKETHKRSELEFLDMLEQALKPFNITGIRQYNALEYRIDYYIPFLNIAIEYDENGHNHYSYEEHEGRQKEIENKLDCRFIRVTDSDSHSFNVGKVIKEIFNLSEVVLYEQLWTEKGKEFIYNLLLEDKMIK